MTPIQKAVALAGGPSKLASACGVTTQAVCFWRDGKRAVPYEQGATIEKEAGFKVTRRDLFPEKWRQIWPEMDQGCHQGGG